MSDEEASHLPSRHDEAGGAFQQIESYDACEETDSMEHEPVAFSLDELRYSAHSFHVISGPGEQAAKPRTFRAQHVRLQSLMPSIDYSALVSVTMVLAALAVTFVNTPETIQQMEDLMAQSYHVWKVGENDATSKQLALDFLNGLVIVTAIGAMTFG